MAKQERYEVRENVDVLDVVDLAVGGVMHRTVLREAADDAAKYMNLADRRAMELVRETIQVGALRFATQCMERHREAFPEEDDLRNERIEQIRTLAALLAEYDAPDAVPAEPKPDEPKFRYYVHDPEGFPYWYVYDRETPNKCSSTGHFVVSAHESELQARQEAARLNAADAPATPPAVEPTPRYYKRHNGYQWYVWDRTPAKPGTVTGERVAAGPFNWEGFADDAVTRLTAEMESMQNDSEPTVKESVTVDPAREQRYYVYEYGSGVCSVCDRSIAVSATTTGHAHITSCVTKAEAEREAARLNAACKPVEPTVKESLTVDPLREQRRFELVMAIAARQALEFDPGRGERDLSVVADRCVRFADAVLAKLEEAKP